MIYIFTALYCEAHILIRQFNLVKNPENAWFQEFFNDTAGIRLTITGVGEINAATAVGSVCAAYKPGQGDVLLNVGTCASIPAGSGPSGCLQAFGDCREDSIPRPLGRIKFDAPLLAAGSLDAGKDGIFLCNKIVEAATGKTFYPDILYRHDFCETAIVTGMLPLNGKGGGAGQAAIPGGNLYDMEAAAVYQAGSYFFGPHQMMFLKVVADGGSAKDVSPKQVEHLMEKYQDRIFSHIGQIHRISYGNGCQGKRLWQEEEAWIEKIGTDMHCSKAMKDSMRQYIRYLALAGTGYRSVIEDMYGEGLLPCKDKREGKLCFEEFKRRLF